MPNYKDTNNKVHFIDSITFECLLPVGSVPITDEEAAELNPQPDSENPRITEIKNELAALDIKRIRPVAEGDTAYLATLNTQALVLRAELQGLL